MEELYKDLDEEELEKFGEAKGVKIDKNSFIVSDGVCPECNIKMDKIVENKNLFDGSLTFHIIKYRCQKCKKEYLDLNEAEKYDLYLSFRKINRPIPFIIETLGKID